MLIVGRITKDAVVNQLKNDKEVVNFSVAINDFYKPKGSNEGVKQTTFINCSYWISTRIAESLKKGSLVEVNGRIFVSAFMDKNSQPKGSINCHVNIIKIHRSTKPEGAQPFAEVADKTDDLPF